MIKVVMYDLGGTLENGLEPLPHARESVAAVSRFKTQGGAALNYCLASDFTLAVPFSADRVDEIFDDYLTILGNLELRDLFEPVARRVTLSTHANVMKPDRKVFELALERLGSSAGLEESLFITENAAHIAGARALGMECLHFGGGGADGFSSWPEGLLKIALLVDPDGTGNISGAMEVMGEAQGLGEIHDVTVSDAGILAVGQALVTLDDSSLGELDGVHVQMPVQVKVDPSVGRPAVEIQMPADAKDEAVAFVRSLQAHGKVGDGGPSLLGPPTHAVETDKSGRRVLKRRGYD